MYVYPRENLVFAPPSSTMRCACQAPSPRLLGTGIDAAQERGVDQPARRFRARRAGQLEYHLIEA